VTDELGLFGNRRGSIQIWGCVGGYAAYTPPNLEIITVNPNEPELEQSDIQYKEGIIKTMEI